jgi:H+-translocating NAD(P) transhydrogenase subunit alpha
MRVLVGKEHVEGETRVSATPETIKQMRKAKLEVHVASGAGEAAFISDQEYRDAGAVIETDLASAYRSADVLLKVRPLGRCEGLDGPEVEALREGATVIGFLAPYGDADLILRMRDRRLTTLPMELVPRITRAQKMDALSSQASLAGYKAVIVAAAALPKYLPLMMTAAGTVKPARVIVMGAGVAGLQAIATAKRLGAVVFASDIRPEVKEQVESLGGKFIDLPGLGGEGVGGGGYAKELSKELLDKQRAALAEHLTAADVIITTALVPGKPAPKLVPASVVERMRPGSVIVDLAVEQGGNCELSERGKEVRKHGVLLIGHDNLPATMPSDASTLYARNVNALLMNVVRDGALHIDLEDEVTRGTLLTHDGALVAEAVRRRIEGGAP